MYLKQIYSKDNANKKGRKSGFENYILKKLSRVFKFLTDRLDWCGFKYKG